MPDSTSPDVVASETRRTPLTLELALYAALLLIGFLLRFWSLGAQPLAEEGVRVALGVLGLDTLPAFYSALLYDAQALFFGLFGASTIAARLLPAVVGALSLLFPWVLRRHVGRWGALSMAFLLALSPAWLLASRSSSEVILVGVVSLAWLIAVLETWKGNDRSAKWAIVLVGIGLAAGGAFVGTLAGGLVAGLVAYRVSGDEGRRVIRERVACLSDSRAWLLSLGVFVLLGSALLTHLDGIAATVDAVGQMFSLAPGLWWQQIVVMIIDEPLLTLLAITGAVIAIRKRDPLGMGLTLWALVALLYGMVSSQPLLNTFVGFIVPSVVLAGIGLEQIVTGWPRPDWQIAVVLFAIGLFVVFGWLSLATYALFGEVLVLELTWIACGIGIVAALVLGSNWTVWSAGKIALAVLLLLGFMGTVKSATAVGLEPASDPREILVGTSVSPQVSMLEEWLSSYSSHTLGDAHAASVAVQPGVDPWVLWAVRDFEHTSETLAGRPYDVLISAGDVEGPQDMVAQTFVMTRSWDWTERLDEANDILRWLLWREPVGVLDETSVRVWIWAN